MAIDWTASMQQTFEFYTVDPNTWKDVDAVTNISSCTVDRDSSQETRGSATIDAEESMDECYLRVYLIAIQNDYTYRVPLGTYLIQTPGISFDGKSQTVSIDAYTPLMELKENLPPIGYTIFKGEAIMSLAVSLTREHLRAPVVPATDTEVLSDDFVANTSDTWLSFLSDLIENADYSYDLDELGRILFAPDQDIASMQPVWTYTDDNSSILYPDVEDERDLYGIPNVVEVVYSTDTGYLYSKIVNDDPSSPISTVTRGREIVYRDSNPSISGEPTQGVLDDYATNLLKELSCLEHTLTYKHGYCGVRVGDCVELNYERAGLSHVKAKVTAQSISCETGCPVEETAVYTTKLWR
ncbi:MAG: hypothetical protein LUI14_14565 [Lachnospiraceae bacterium]|nr:hypothetical protein [Lachnospiraceae bacterium]